MEDEGSFYKKHSSFEGVCDRVPLQVSELYEITFLDFN